MLRHVSWQPSALWLQLPRSQAQHDTAHACVCASVCVCERKKERKWESLCLHDLTFVSHSVSSQPCPASSIKPSFYVLVKAIKQRGVCVCLVWGCVCMCLYHCVFLKYPLWERMNHLLMLSIFSFLNVLLLFPLHLSLYSLRTNIFSFLQDCLLFSVTRGREQNKAPCFVLHLINVAPKTKPLRASPSYASYVCLIPQCLLVGSDFLHRRCWIKC